MKKSGQLKSPSKVQSRPLATAFLLSLLHPATGLWSPQFAQEGKAKRGVTVADSIRMARTTTSLPGRFSPDGKKFVVVIRRGNLERNTNDYSMLLWTVEGAASGSAPELVLTMSSSSNRPAIEEPQWLSDGTTVVFLGENPGEEHEIYAVNVTTRVPKRLTSHPTSLLAWSLTPPGNQIAYVADVGQAKLWNDKMREEGIVVSSQSILDLVKGTTGSGYLRGYPLYVASVGSPGRILITHDPVRNVLRGKPVISPDGKYVVIATEVGDIPAIWKEYEDPSIQRLAAARVGPGQGTFLWRFELVNTITGESRFLLNSPVGTLGSEVAWAPDSHSVVITRIFLPLEDAEGEQRGVRKRKSFTVEINVYSRELAVITQEDLFGVAWDERHNGIISHLMRTDSNTSIGLGDSVFFQKNNNGWQKIAVAEVQEPRPEIVAEEDLHTPPRLILKQPGNSHRTVLLDLNPQFHELNFARVEEIHWRGTGEQEIKGGLYYPTNFGTGKRYPLVIQTHGWSAKRFMIDGPFTTGYAAQALANQGIMVLAADDNNLGSVSTESEAPREMASYEGAVEDLDRAGMVDRDRVGIMGFSRSRFFVKYTLTHSKLRFAAAAVTDGIDEGYFQYIQFLNRGSAWSGDAERTNGGPPWGEGLKHWVDLSPAFNVDRVATPMRIVALNPSSLLRRMGMVCST